MLVVENLKIVFKSIKFGVLSNLNLTPGSQNGGLDTSGKYSVKYSKIVNHIVSDGI